jgi:hypothetical protein
MPGQYTGYYAQAANILFPVGLAETQAFAQVLPVGIAIQNLGIDSSGKQCIPGAIGQRGFAGAG